MALEGPQLHYARTEGIEMEDTLTRALRLAREAEELLEEAPSVIDSGRAHSTRIARAMAAGLVDELESLVRGQKKTGAA